MLTGAPEQESCPAASDRSEPDRPLAEPSQLARFLRDYPVVSHARGGWKGVALHRFCNLPPVIDLPAIRDEMLVGHLGGPFLAEVGVGTPRYERRWIVPGQVGINPAGAPVHRELKGRPDVVLLHLPPARLHAVAEEAFEVDPSGVELVPTLAATDQTAERLIGLLLQEAASPEPGLPLMVESLTHAVMVHLLRHHSNLAPRPQQPLESLSPGRVRRVVEHMRANLGQALPLADLASVAGLSTSRFVRAFRAATGEPPHRSFVRMRIEHACHLLERTDLPVTEVGLRCGFDQPSHFASMFRKVVGMPPSTWRRERRA